jgi:hypothetical protein
LATGAEVDTGSRGAVVPTAPDFTSRSTTGVWPRWRATLTALSPAFVRAFTSTPFVMSVFTVSVSKA